jgi:hypothetical protein
LNRHLVFTHGYGFTVSTVNTAGADGLPLYFVKDLGQGQQVQGIPQLGISTAMAQRALPVGRPRLYYASAPSPYAIAPTQVREFDYPEGELNVYTHYDGGAHPRSPGPFDGGHLPTGTPVAVHRVAHPDLPTADPTSGEPAAGGPGPVLAL